MGGLVVQSNTSPHMDVRRLNNVKARVKKNDAFA